MNPDGVTRFRLSIWRPAQVSRALDYAPHSGETSTTYRPFKLQHLHEEIYHWNPGAEDVWSSLSDSEATVTIRDVFVNGFSPNLPPSQRSMMRFGEAIARLRDVIGSDELQEWPDMLQTVRIRGTEEANLRCHPTLAFLHHIEWLLRTFETVPGASVTIR